MNDAVPKFGLGVGHAAIADRMTDTLSARTLRIGVVTNGVHETAVRVDDRWRKYSVLRQRQLRVSAAHFDGAVQPLAIAQVAICVEPQPTPPGGCRQCCS